jgi:sec-independent protein translocase protein TatA
METEMFGIGMGELLVILGIVVLLFGTKRLKTLGADLGTAIKGFRSAVKEEESAPAPRERVIEGEIDSTPRPADKRKQDTNV